MGFLFSNMYDQIPTVWANIVLTFMSVICGAIVGIERQRKEKAAGLRTIVLIAFGSSIFTMLSRILAATGDQTRIAAQIVTGIGFIGAGAILRGPMGIQGLTTAATIWTMAAIGMVVGAGYAYAGLSLSIFVYALLMGLSMVEVGYLGSCAFNHCTLLFDPNGGKAIIKIDEILHSFPIAAESKKITDAANHLKQLRFVYCCAHKAHRECLKHLVELPEVREIEGDT